MKPFRQLILEADVDGFIDKINTTKTIDGLDELESYYEKRKKERLVKDSADISVRDAIEGRRNEIKQEIIDIKNANKK